MRDASPELRRAWRRNWLSSIRELSAGDWQRRLWGKSDNPHHSFDEYLSMYFDEVVLDGYGARIAEGLISREEADAVADFHIAFDRYQAPIGPVKHDDILADPAWIEVVALANHARAALLTLIDDPDERQLLLRDEPEYP
jgi:hypothetical protein